MASLCSDCSVARAAVSCCGVRLCLLHGYTSKHAAHEKKWAVYNRAVYDSTLPAVKQVRQNRGCEDVKM